MLALEEADGAQAAAACLALLTPLLATSPPPEEQIEQALMIVTRQEYAAALEPLRAMRRQLAANPSWTPEMVEDVELLFDEAIGLLAE
ncbi:MAG: hypothetical protein EOO77_46760 [Oxalobacteraceae bacterium]|nr:MAG: hypothetical protein EOO77_46760 [Oxalobacteraceae bacterium]